MVRQCDFKLVTLQRLFSMATRRRQRCLSCGRRFRSKYCIIVFTGQYNLMFNFSHTCLCNRKIMVLEFPTWRFAGLNCILISITRQPTWTALMACLVTRSDCFDTTFSRCMWTTDGDRHWAEQQSPKWTWFKFHDETMIGKYTKMG